VPAAAAVGRDPRLLVHVAAQQTRTESGGGKLWAA